MNRTCKSENENLGRPVPASVTPLHQAAHTKQPGGIIFPPALAPDLFKRVHARAVRAQSVTGQEAGVPIPTGAPPRLEMGDKT